MTSPVLAALGAALPQACLVTDPDRLQSYRYDRAMFCPAGTPAAVVLARETAHVQAVLRIAGEYGVPVVPQGARSGLSGAANAVDGGIVLTLERMDRILEIDPGNRLVVTQPGVLNAVLSRAVGEHGLFYPPDPSSWEFCSIGGNVATNAGGLCCVKYGVTADYVLGLEVVLASGDVLRTGRRTAKGVAGYDLTRLFVGSEGTLGVITEATLLLRPKAEQPLTVAAVFDSTAAAANAVATVLAEGPQPSLLEFMDATTVAAVEQVFHVGFAPDTQAVLLAQSDAGLAQAPAELQTVADIFKRCGAVEVATADDPAEADLLMAARRGVLPAMERLGTTLIDDVCVPRTRLAEFVDAVERIAAEHRVRVGVVGHVGDGNFHPNIVFDGTDAGESRRAHLAFEQIMLAGLELGGTITGEHGVGLLKRQLLERELGPVGTDVHRAIKRALDPAGILNPGKVVAL